MTPPLTPEQKTNIRIALAKFAGWQDVNVMPSGDIMGWPPRGTEHEHGNRFTHALDYPASLDDCHSIEVKLTGPQWDAYCRTLEPMVRKAAEIDRWKLINPSWLIDALIIHASAEQKSLALFRALNLGELGD